jgi:8-oxo-dGTP pyrophosphatase MutT (NUDIX family)
MAAYAVLDQEWMRRFAEAGRSPQGRMIGQCFVVHDLEGSPIRVFIPAVYVRDEIELVVNNAQECQRCGAVSVLFDPTTGKVGLVEPTRPVIRPERIPEYKRAWDTFLPHDVEGFAAAVAPFMGSTYFEFPQGRSEVGETGEQTAEREGGEEGGFLVTDVAHLGFIATDSAQRLDPVESFLVTVDVHRPAEQSADPHEWQGRTVTWVDLEGLNAFVRDGRIINGLSISCIKQLEAKGILG